MKQISGSEEVADSAVGLRDAMRPVVMKTDWKISLSLQTDGRFSILGGSQWHERTRKSGSDSETDRDC